MTEHQKRSMVEILTLSPSLRELVNKVDQLTKLNRVVLKKLDPELAKHCRVANLRDGILIITTPSPASGHLLRFATTELLSALRSEPEWCHLKSIKTHVQPSLYGHQPQIQDPKASQSQKRSPLSAASATIIRDIAQNVSSEALKKALLGLARSFI